MDLRSDVQSVLNRFEHRDPTQVQRALEYRDFVHAHEDALRRSCAVGHVTASALVIDSISGFLLCKSDPGKFEISNNPYCGGNWNNGVDCAFNWVGFDQKHILSKY
jgi:hypothetical protein